MKQKKTKQIVTATLLAAVFGTAHATDVFRLEGFGPISKAMGGTATAYDVGPAGMMTNPATLSLMKQGSELLLGVDMITTEITVTDQTTGQTASPSSQGNNRGPYLAPEIAYTQRSGPLSFGVGAFAQGGLGTEYGSSSFLSQAGSVATNLDNSSRLLVLDIPLAASYDVNEKFSVGGSIDVMWTGLNLNLLLGGSQVGGLAAGGRASGALVGALASPQGPLGASGLGNLAGAQLSFTKNQPIASGASAWGIDERIGLIYKLTSDTTLGAAYTFKSQLSDLQGDATLTAVRADNQGQIPLTGKVTIRNFQMPAVLNLGVSHHLNDQVLLTGDVSQVFWKDVMKDINVGFVANSGANLDILLPQNYSDQTILALGAAYKTGDWTIRGGAQVATQALDSNYLLAVIPATPTKHISGGFSYDFSKENTVNFAYSHAFQETMTNPGGNTNSVPPIQTIHSQDNFVIAYSRHF
jgi:long-chain fatty acid transport protein